MARFRYVGSGWRTTDGITALGQQVEQAWPDRHPADGTVAGSGHAKWPTSDHGISPEGFVRALDVGVYGDQGAVLSLQLQASRDSRIAYVIHNNRILRSYPKSWAPVPWQWYPYTGSNPHVGHVHISTLRNTQADFDASPWPINLEGENMLTIQQLQEALNAAGQTDPDGDPLAVDGEYGPKTEYALTNGLRPASVPADVLRAGDRVRLRKVTPAPPPS